MITFRIPVIIICILDNSPYFIDFYWNILTVQYHVSFCCTMNESAVCVHISLPLGPDDFGCFLPSLIWQLNLEP